VRFDDDWLFVSYGGIVHPLDVSGATPHIGSTWSLLSDADRDADWRIAGNQHLAVHAASGRLFSLVRQNPDPLDDPGVMDGTEIWVYDLGSRRRIARWEARPDEAVGGDGSGDSIGGTSGDGVANIAVTQGEQPLLIAAGNGVSARNAMSGAYVHERLEHAPPGGRLTVP